MNLKKGENVALDSIKYTENRLLVGLGCGVTHNEFDIDASAFLLDCNNVVRSNEDFIFYNQLSDENQCIKLNPDCDDKDFTSSFSINLSKISDDVDQIMFVLTIDQAEKRNQNFSMIEDVRLLVFDNDGEKLIKFNLETEHEEVALMVASLYRYQDKWKFKAIGQGFSKGLEAIADQYKVNLNELKEKADNVTIDVNPNSDSALKRKRKTPNQVLAERSKDLLVGLQQILPTIHDAREKKANESNTRMILDRIFIDVFGYKIDEVKAEQEIQGRRADYVLSTGETDAIVVEVKKIGMVLKDKQIFQATSYGAYSGIRWVLLTNLVQWNVYHVSMGDKVDANLVFSIDLNYGVTQQDADFLVLLSRYGLSRKGLMEKAWAEANALSENSIVSSILTDDVISKIRLVVKRDRGVAVTNEKIQTVLENILNLN